MWSFPYLFIQKTFKFIFTAVWKCLRHRSLRQLHDAQPVRQRAAMQPERQRDVREVVGQERDYVSQPDRSGNKNNPQCFDSN